MNFINASLMTRIFVLKSSLLSELSNTEYFSYLLLYMLSFAVIDMAGIPFSS